MAEYAPLFAENANVLPKNTTPLTSRLVKDAIRSQVIGAAPGGTATVNKARVKATPSNANDLFNAQIIETDTQINRATTAADVTALKAKSIEKNASFTYPKDLSGNGGPAFTRS